MKKFIIILSMVVVTSAMALTPAERQIAQHAQQELRVGKQQLAEAQEAAFAANQAASEASDHAQKTDQEIGVLKKQIDDSKRNEENLAKEVKRLQPYESKLKSLNGHWGLNAIGYGIGLLVKHILITVAVVAVLAIAVFVASKFFPVIGPFVIMIGSFFGGVFKIIGAVALKFMNWVAGLFKRKS